MSSNLYFFKNILPKKLYAFENKPAAKVLTELFTITVFTEEIFALYITCLFIDLVVLRTCLDLEYTPRRFFPSAPEPPIRPATPPMTTEVLRLFYQ